MFPLHSRRLILRHFTDADLQPFLGYRNDPEVARYQSWDGCSMGEATAFIRIQKSMQWGIPGQWLQIAIALRETNLLIGDCALQVQENDVRQATIGVTLARSHQGFGFAREALSSLLDYVFFELGLHRVSANTDPQNRPAWTLFERLGLRREAHLSQSLWFKGRWADEYLYAVLRQDWIRYRADHPPDSLQPPPDSSSEPR